MLLLIDKPSGITSHDAISAVKKHLRQPLRDAISDEDKAQGIKPPKIKIGHAGTLDPMASGLLIAATDSDTKQLHTLTGHDKRYETTIDFSIQTDTWDMDYRKEYEKYTITQIPPTPFAKGGDANENISHRYSKEFIQGRGLLSTGYHLPYSKDAHEKAKELRKNMTETETLLRKKYLQKSGYTVLRQKAIDHYIVDFYIAQYKLVIEIDGEYHHSLDQQEYDQERTDILEFYGLHVLRFTNEEILDSLGSVVQTIQSYIDTQNTSNSEKETNSNQTNETFTSLSPSLAKRGLGVIIDGKHLPAPTINQITKYLHSIIGTPNLPLTPFSAKKVDGKKLYDYARAGNPIFLTVPMTIHGYEIIDYAFPLLTLRLHVGSGTYIRSIAHRLGTQFDLGGVLTMLRRTQIGEYKIDQISEESKQVALWDEKEVVYNTI